MHALQFLQIGSGNAAFDYSPCYVLTLRPSFSFRRQYAVCRQHPPPLVALSVLSRRDAWSWFDKSKFSRCLPPEPSAQEMPSLLCSSVDETPADSELHKHLFVRVAENNQKPHVEAYETNRAENSMMVLLCDSVHTLRLKGL